MIGAAALAFDGLDAAGGCAHERGRLIVCPTPIGNLEDVTLRVLAALREADVVACEDTRRTRVLLDRYGVNGAARQLPRAQRARARRRAGRADARRAPSSRSSPTPGCRSSPIPASCSCRRASPPGWRSRCCPGRRRRSRRSSPRALPADRWRFVGFLPRKRGELRAAVRGRRRRSSRSSRRGASPRRSRCSPALDPERPVAVCRELTKLHEEVVPRDAPPSSPRATRGEPPRGEVVLVVGAGAPGAQARRSGARRRRAARARRGRRQAAAGGEGRRRADRACRANALLPGAHRAR